MISTLRDKSVVPHKVVLNLIILLRLETDLFFCPNNRQLLPRLLDFKLLQLWKSSLLGICIMKLRFWMLYRVVNILTVLKKVFLVDIETLRTLILVLKTGTTDREESSSRPSTGSGLCFEFFPPIIHCSDCHSWLLLWSCQFIMANTVSLNLSKVKVKSLCWGFETQLETNNWPWQYLGTRAVRRPGPAPDWGDTWDIGGGRLVTMGSGHPWHPPSSPLPCHHPQLLSGYPEVIGLLLGAVCLLKLAKTLKECSKTSQCERIYFLWLKLLLD